jgi:signal transduction histidine kinase/CheY-like chemotaxis protein
MPDTQNHEMEEWSESEFTEIRQRSLKVSIWLLGLIAWGTSFRYWESVQLKDAGFFLTACLTLLVTWVVYRKQGLRAASWVCIIGTILSLLVESVFFPGSWVWILLAVPILQTGILIGSSATAWVGFGEGVLVILTNVIIGAQIPLNPAIYYLAVTTAIVWYTSQLIDNSIFQTVFYALNNKKTLEEARTHQGRLVRAVKSMDESNARLVKAYDNITLLQHEADQFRQQKIQFANMISHEMRTPLNFIIGATEMMVKSPHTYGDRPWPSGLHEDILRIFQSSQHLLNLINDVLALGQIEANRMVLTFSVSSLSSILEELAKILGTSFTNNGLYLDIQVDPDLPLLKMDRIRIWQVLLNLISNALRHTKTGGVRISVRREMENILVSVEDTGLGIPPEHLGNLFQEFYQGDLNNEISEVQTSGLGLAISKQYIELHGGYIWVESPIQEPHDGQGPGSRFSFTLPLGGMTINLQSLWVGQNNAYFQRRGDRAGTKETILIYSALSSKLFTQLPISLSGYQIAHCATETELAQALEQFDPCGVIQVYEGPIKEEIPGIVTRVPWVKCQVQAEDLDLTEMWDAYLTKPSTPDQVRSALENIGGTFATCLVIDDDPDIGRFIELTFLSVGLNVDVRYAATGEKGVELMLSFMPSVTFLDINLPDISGWKVLKMIRETAQISDLPVIIFSALDNPNPVVINLQSLNLVTPFGQNSYVMNDILQGIFDSLSTRV